jgi:hypothetical protein
MTHAPRYRRRFRIQASIAGQLTTLTITPNGRRYRIQASIEVVHPGTAIRSVGEPVRPIYFTTVLTPDGEPGLQR